MEVWGFEWLTTNWKYVQEDKIEHYRVTMALMPLARSPMDKKGASGLADYQKKLERMLNAAVPWQKRASGRRESLRGKVKPGEVVVILERGESANDPLYSDARTIRE